MTVQRAAFPEAKVISCTDSGYFPFFHYQYPCEPLQQVRYALHCPSIIWSGTHGNRACCSICLWPEQALPQPGPLPTSHCSSLPARQTGRQLKRPLHFKEQCFMRTTSHASQPWGLVHQLIVPVHGAVLLLRRSKAGQLFADPVTAFDCRAVGLASYPMPGWQPSDEASPCQWAATLVGWSSSTGATVQELGTPKVMWSYIW